MKFFAEEENLSWKKNHLTAFVQWNNITMFVIEFKKKSEWYIYIGSFLFCLNDCMSLDVD